MKCFKKLLLSLLAVTMMVTGMHHVRAEGEEEPNGEESTFEPGPILNDPLDYSDGLVIDENTEVRSGQLLNNVLRDKLEKDIDRLLNFQPVDSDRVDSVLCAVDTYLESGGLGLSSTDTETVLQGSNDLSQMANTIGLQKTGDHLIEVVETNANATGYIFVIDRNSVAFRVEDTDGEGIPNALVTISYKNSKGETVTRAQYTTSGEKPGLCGFDSMKEVEYMLIDVQAPGYRAQTVLDKKVTAGDILYFQLEESPENDIYLRCVDMAGKDMSTEDTNLFLVESGSKPLQMRVIVTVTGNKSLPEKITLKEYETQRSITVFSAHSQYEIGGTASRMFSVSADWLKQGGMLKEDDILMFNLGGGYEVLKHVRVKNALVQPGTSDEQFPLTGTDKEVPFTDVMGGTGIASFTIKYFKIPVTIGFFPEGGFIIVATFDIESLSTKYSSLFQESWNPKTRSEGESILEPFKQEFWRKADRFKSGTGQMNDSKRVSFARDKYMNFTVSFSLFCSGVWNDKTKNFDGSFGGIFDVKLDGGMTQYFLVSTPIVVPFYLGFNLSGEFKSNITAHFVWNKLSDGIGAAFSAADHVLTQRYDLVAGLELYAGVGLKGVCSLEAAGGATMDFAAIEGTVDEPNKQATRFLIDSFAHIRVSAAIAFFSFNLFNKTFGPWRLADTHPDKITEILAQEDVPGEFLDIALSETNENGTLLMQGTDDKMNHYKSNLLSNDVTTVNEIQTISTLSADTFGDSQVQIASTGTTTALFRIASIDGRARIIYQKQDPVTGKFVDDYFELPAFMGYDVAEFNVAASPDDRFFYVACVVVDPSKTDINSRSLTSRVQGLVLDLEEDRVYSTHVKSPIPDFGKYFYFNPRVAGRDGKIAVAYQKTQYYGNVSSALACVFGTNEKEIVMGKGSVFSNGDIVPGEPSFFVTNRDHTTSYRLVVDGYMADGSFDENNPRQRFSTNINDYELRENEFFLTNWGYANNTNYAVIASKLYYLEKYPDNYDSYGYGMRLTQVENSEGLINRENSYQFVINDDRSGICLVSSTTSYTVNMETGENEINGSTLKVHTLEARYDESTKTNKVILHGPLDIFVKGIDVCTFAAVFNRENCQAKGLSIVYATSPEVTLTADGKAALSGNLYQWQQNLKRGMVTTNVDFEDLFYYNDELALPVIITFRNIGYAIEGPVAFTIKDEKGYEIHELYQHPQTKQWYDMGTEVVHNLSGIYTGDTVQLELYIAPPRYWEVNRVHEVRVEIAKDYRGDAVSNFTAPVYHNSLTLAGQQIVLGDKHYADLSITNIGSENVSLNKVAVEIIYRENKIPHTSYIDLSEIYSVPDLDKYSVLYDLTPVWDRAEKDGILAVRFYLVDADKQILTGESVFMLPQDTLDIEDISYEIVEGADATWEKGTEEGHVIKVVRSINEETCFSHFTSFSIDGNEWVLDEQYLAESGSTVITLKPQAMEELSEGEHEVVVTFDDGEVTTTLTITAPTDTPPTGEMTNLTYWVALMILAFISMLYIRKMSHKHIA